MNKQGFHSDEIWNYGFANSSDALNIYNKDPEKDIYENIYQWTDSKVLYDYITVDKSEIFAYDKVYNNLKNDLNPPLQFMILHLVCSIFLGKWSMWFGFSINIVSFVLIQLFLFKFIKKVTKNDIAAFSGLLLFGFSVGASSITTFLRMYALGVAFAMMFVYCVNEVYLSRDDIKSCKKNILKSALVLCLGALTIHQFLILAFFIVLLYSFYYLITKRIKLLFAFGLSMCLSVLVSVLVFPSTFSHLFGYTENGIIKKFPTGWQFRIYLSFLTKDISGIHIAAVKTMALPYTFVGIVILVFVLAPVCFLLRKEEKFKKLVLKIKNRFMFGIKNIKRIPYTVVALGISILLYVFVNAKNSSIFRMGIYSKRYVFLIYPIYAALVCILLYYLFKFITDKNKARNIIILAMTLGMVLITYHYSSNPFFMKHFEYGVTLEDLGPEADCIAVMSADWVFVSATSELSGTHSYFLTDYASYDEMNYDREDSSHPLYLLLDITNLTDEYPEMPDDGGDDHDDSGDDEEIRIDVYGNVILLKSDILDYYMDSGVADKMECIGIDAVYDRIIEIYRIR